MLKNVTTAMALLAACSLCLAPAAMAQTQTQTQTQNQQKPLQGRQMSTQGHSVPFVLSHAYMEALHAHQSVAMGMNDMARNHLDNVKILVGRIDTQRDVTDAKLRDSLNQLKSRVDNIGSADINATRDLVSRFSNVVAAMPMPQGGGGGAAGMTPMLLLPGELVAKASDSAVNMQVDASQRNMAGAKLHAQHTVATLDAAIRSAQMNKMQPATIRQLQELRSRAVTVQGQLNSNPALAAKSAGDLVVRLGTALPNLTMAGAGGGAGTGNGQMQHNNKK